ncbi:helix-turn-helix domain-containing protein [Nocardia neocaledoniensis]|uniref:helix-turn-helix domain-containing protein n=1 Tax=Nocardia neocaledoniensis TaxID=236511 RepID=UPI0024587267|nr:helix-turn-helix domain-containing protein [Nocardia neocaledoniensis]
MTFEELSLLPSVLNVEEAGRALGIDRVQAYTLVKYGGFPVPVNKVGQRYRIATESVLRYLGVERGVSDHDERTQASTSAEEPDNSCTVRTKRGKVIDPDKHYRDRRTDRVYKGEDIIAMARVLGVAS